MWLKLNNLNKLFLSKVPKWKLLWRGFHFRETTLNNHCRSHLRALDQNQFVSQCIRLAEGWGLASRKRPQEKQSCPGSSCSRGLINDFSHAAGEQQVDKSTAGCSVQGSAGHWLETNTAALSAGGHACQVFSSRMNKVTATGSASDRYNSGSSHLVLFTDIYCWQGSVFDRPQAAASRTIIRGPAELIQWGIRSGTD